ncbi:MAG: tRNA 2-thiouridine(34) synthase MnmA [Deltaproteobacteria bacterium]|nr:tRNA 2-thiouridine(34) synthase MnmA [Deltaproteobacteria bacterium]
MDAHFNVVVALSGGVDSAMAAVLLKAAGWDVCGLYFVLSSVAASKGERVRRIAARIGIPLKIVDLSERFETEVVGPFCDTYLAGLTPNPCVTCNQRIKFNALYRYAEERNIRCLATGHYVRLDTRERAGGTALLRGMDKVKDQSYFLQRLGQDTLSRAVFPLGDLTKDEIRRRARDMGLPCHSHPESQEICFISGMDYREFVEKKRGVGVRQKGVIVNAEGVSLGVHEGVYRYTIGQRHGLGIASSRPYYVKEIRPDQNQVVVGRREALFTRIVHARDVRWIQGPPNESPVKMEAQVRYRHRAAPGRLEVLSPDEIRFVFDRPQWAVAPGQALACYDGDRLIGGGWITG